MKCMFATKNRLLDCEVVIDIFPLYPCHRLSSKNNWKRLKWPKLAKNSKVLTMAKSCCSVLKICFKWYLIKIWAQSYQQQTNWCLSYHSSATAQQYIYNQTKKKCWILWISSHHFFAFCTYMPIINSLLLPIHSSFNLTPLLILRHLKHFKGSIAFQICKPLTWHLSQYQYDSLLSITLPHCGISNASKVQ